MGIMIYTHADYFVGFYFQHNSELKCIKNVLKTYEKSVVRWMNKKKSHTKAKVPIVNQYLREENFLLFDISIYWRYERENVEKWNERK